MKFGKYFERQVIEEWKFFYVDYKKLKYIIKNDKNSSLFYKLINNELGKLNKFINLIQDYNNVQQNQICNFLVLNYMALFKSVKKHDKRLCKSTKIDFFKNIQKYPFYQYYLDIPRPSNDIKLVIFDKDGTLINHEKIFGKWLIKLVKNLSPLISCQNDLFNHLGYDPVLDKFDFTSIVARGTNDDIRNSIYDFIINKNSKKTPYTVDLDNLKYKINKLWVPLNVEFSDLEQCGDILKVFKFLKSKRIKIAICTSDDRKPTEDLIRFLNLSQYIDDIKCGDDPLSSKPSPEPIWKICSNLGVNLENTLMIGDTISDIHAGINAKCAKVVGVLSGGYGNVDLEKADKIINSIDDLPKLILNYSENVTNCNQKKLVISA